MRRTLIRLLSIIGLLALARSATAQSPHLRIEVLRTLGQEVPLGVILGGAVARDGTVYLVDLSNSWLWVFPPNGGPPAKCGANGEGPGEFQKLYRVAVRDDGSLLAYDLATGEISEFDRECRFIRRQRLSLNLRQVGSFAIVGDQLVISGTAALAGPLSDSAVHVFGSDLSYVRSFGAAPRFSDPRKLEYLGTGFLTIGGHRRILFTHRRGYEVDVYSIVGRRLRTVKVERALRGDIADAVTLSDESGRFNVRSSGNGVESAVPVVELTGGKFLGARLLDHQMSFDLLTPDGKVLASTPPSTPIGILGPGPEADTFWASTTANDVPVLQLIHVTVD